VQCYTAVTLSIASFFSPSWSMEGGSDAPHVAKCQKDPKKDTFQETLTFIFSNSYMQLAQLKTNEQ
jgi:hypothetical protein